MRAAIALSSAGSIMRSAPDTAYHVGRLCHAAGPDGVKKIGKLNARCCAFSAAAAFGLRSCAKSARKYAGSIKQGEANGAPAKIRWGSAAGGLYPAPRLARDSPWSGANAAVYTRDATSESPKEALVVPSTAYECQTKTFLPGISLRACCTRATSPARESRPSVGVTV